MIYLLVLAMLFSLTAHAEASNREIDGLVTRLSNDPFRFNGLFTPIHLPADASLLKIIDEALKVHVFPPGQHLDNYKIVTTESVVIPKNNALSWNQQTNHHPEYYFAVIVETNLGKKILLIRYEDGVVGWWCHVYDTETPNNTPHPTP